MKKPLAFTLPVYNPQAIPEEKNIAFRQSVDKGQFNCKVFQEESGRVVIEGICSQEIESLTGHILTPEAMAKIIEDQKGITTVVNIEHEQSTSQIIGEVDYFYITFDGGIATLKYRAILNDPEIDPEAKNILESYNNGVKLGISIEGYMYGEDWMVKKYNEEDDTWSYVINKILLKAIAITARPAVPTTTMVVVQAIQDAIKKAKEESAISQKENGGDINTKEHISQNKMTIKITKQHLEQHKKISESGLKEGDEISNEKFEELSAVEQTETQETKAPEATPETAELTEEVKQEETKEEGTTDVPQEAEKETAESKTEKVEQAFRLIRQSLDDYYVREESVWKYLDPVYQLIEKFWVSVDYHGTKELKRLATELYADLAKLTVEKEVMQSDKQDKQNDSAEIASVVQNAVSSTLDPLLERISAMESFINEVKAKPVDDGKVVVAQKATVTKSTTADIGNAILGRD
jgi:hypothetical protein